MWRETLKEYSVQEFQAAIAELVKHPPKWVLPDGEIQVWRGLPKLPDVVGVMLDLREARAAEYRRREAERLSAEMRELEKRRAENPEEFFGWADVLKRFREIGAMPAHQMTDEEWKERQHELAKQRREIEAKENTA